ncbi:MULTISPECIES: metallophosphoesterase family protein [unclassified Nitratiruptor]|uniref:metallophosphoesterase family protein n=1 Tax=unclassified Nitratiruptor TaxID=2624044 RepID=UPI0019158CD3|nr:MULTISPECIES: metallophosphoesterase family protein [unclassified Nitratiruptor]BCD60953.1 hypothetical protein NitYY0810_C1731 [Nitratiruptor sp. YY08-10]BCD64885.1 hypothetical protein NitYY0814_C1739 [Nitratiruptor sp. YY08-14]
MKIGIISDTHNRVDFTKEAVEKLKSFEIAYLIHAGDIGEEVCQYLDGLDIPVIAVYGNTDSAHLFEMYPHVNLQKQPYYFTIENTTFKLMHQPYYLTPDSDIVIYGHLHEFECQKAKALFLNPGEVCAREKPRIESALLELESRNVFYIYKDLEKNSWMEERVCA